MSYQFIDDCPTQSESISEICALASANPTQEQLISVCKQPTQLKQYLHLCRTIEKPEDWPAEIEDPCMFCHHNRIIADVNYEE